MSDRSRTAVIAGLIVVMSIVLIALVATNPSEADRAEAIGARIRCPVCQGESVAASPSNMARDMMGLIQEQIDAGLSDDEIIDELLASFSGAVLLDPPAGGSTLLLWLAPAAALVIGVAVILWWRRHPAEPSGESRGDGPARPRRLAQVAILALAFAAIVVTVGFFLQDSPGAAEGAAAIDVGNLDEVSNETMEAVIAANSDNPQINGMRLALAERYYDEGDYRSAFPHYLAVAESPIASQSEITTALVRLGWMAWVGNSEADAALALFDEALAVDGSSTAALYYKGQVLWCGKDDLSGAADLFQEVLDSPDLTSDSVESVRSDLDAVQQGVSCT